LSELVSTRIRTTVVRIAFVVEGVVHEWQMSATWAADRNGSPARGQHHERVNHITASPSADDGVEYHDHAHRAVPSLNLAR
jgi:hypothetical protein